MRARRGRGGSRQARQLHRAGDRLLVPPERRERPGPVESEAARPRRRRRRERRARCPRSSRSSASCGVAALELDVREQLVRPGGVRDVLRQLDRSERHARVARGRLAVRLGRVQPRLRPVEARLEDRVGRLLATWRSTGRAAPARDARLPLSISALASRIESRASTSSSPWSRASASACSSSAIAASYSPRRGRTRGRARRRSPGWSTSPSPSSRAALLEPLDRLVDAAGVQVDLAESPERAGPRVAAVEVVPRAPACRGARRARAGRAGAQRPPREAVRFRPRGAMPMAR